MKMATIAHSTVEQLERTGNVVLDRDQLWQFFDAEARGLVGLSGAEALADIRSGKTGAGLGWTELILLASLLDR
jgi:hypothetical protein